MTEEVDRVFPNSFQYHQVLLLDLPTENLHPYWDRALDFVGSGINARGAVLYVFATID